MTENPVTVNEDVPINELAKIMVSNKIHRLIVMRNDSIVGIVSTFDLLNHIALDNPNE